MPQIIIVPVLGLVQREHPLLCIAALEGHVYPRQGVVVGGVHPLEEDIAQRIVHHVDVGVALVAVVAHPLHGVAIGVDELIVVRDPSQARGDAVAVRGDHKIAVAVLHRGIAPGFVCPRRLTRNHDAPVRTHSDVRGGIQQIVLTVVAQFPLQAARVVVHEGDGQPMLHFVISPRTSRDSVHKIGRMQADHKAKIHAPAPCHQQRRYKCRRN